MTTRTKRPVETEPDTTADSDIPPQGTTRTGQLTDRLTTRRDELTQKLADLESHNAGIVDDVRAADADWRAALEAGHDTALITERRRHREAELAENERAGAQIQQWLQEVEQQLTAKAPHEQLDRDLTQHAIDVQSFTDLQTQLQGAHARALDQVVAAATELHQLMRDVRDRADQINTRAAQLHNRAAALQRTETAANVDWQQSLEHELRGTAAWGLYLSSIQQPAHGLAIGLGAEASRVLRVRRP